MSKIGLENGKWKMENGKWRAGDRPETGSVSNQ